MVQVALRFVTLAGHALSVAPASVPVPPSTAEHPSHATLPFGSQKQNCSRLGPQARTFVQVNPSAHMLPTVHGVAAASVPPSALAPPAPVPADPPPAPPLPARPDVPAAPVPVPAVPPPAPPAVPAEEPPAPADAPPAPAAAPPLPL